MRLSSAAFEKRHRLGAALFSPDGAPGGVGWKHAFESALNASSRRVTDASDDHGGKRDEGHHEYRRTEIQLTVETR
ncbi:MAG: hypothetical protein R3D67_21180 [Hyphomicrobiaceae bacterium]